MFDPVLAFAGNDNFFFPPGASTFVDEVDGFFIAQVWVFAIFTIGIMGTVGWFMWKYRARPGYVGSTHALHNNALEITWTVIPSFIVVWIFAQGVVGYLDQMNWPTDTHDIDVTARQWAWTFRYPNSAITSEELHLPVGQPVKLTMRSEDVIHSLFIRQFRVKQDVVPGRYTYMWFEATRVTEPGEHFDLYCTEYCGDKHSMMNVKVFVHTKEDYQTWLENAAKPPEDPAAHGQWLYERVGCKACHSIDGSKNVGPTWQNAWGTQVPISGAGTVLFDENYVRESIYDPQAKIHAGFENQRMNSYRGQLKDNQVDALIAFMRTLQAGGPTPPPAAAAGN